MKAVFSKLGLKENTFKLFDDAMSAKIEKYKLKEDQFDANITDLSRTEDISKFTKLEDFLNIQQEELIIFIFINVVTLSVPIIFH